MTAKILLFALLSVAFAQEETLESFAEDAIKKIYGTVNTINKAEGVYQSLMADRFNCLKWECVKQTEAVNQSIIEAVSKGMQNNKQMNNFQCVANTGREAFEKLNAIEEKIPANSEAVKEKALKLVTSYRIVMEGFSKYVRDFYKKKSEEMDKAANDAAKKKIFNEFAQKIKQLKIVVEQIDAQLATNKQKFFEDYVKFAYTIENNLKNAMREGTQKIQKCVS